MEIFAPKTDQPFSVRGTELRPGDSLEDYLGKLARITLEEMLQPVGVLTTDGVILECNRAALTVGGFARADVVGRRFWEVFWWNAAPATQQLLRDAVRRAAA